MNRITVTEVTVNALTSMYNYLQFIITLVALSFVLQ